MAKVRKLLSASVATSTRKAYAAGFKKWEEFAVSNGFSVMPAEPQEVAMFLAERAEISWGAVQSSSAAINDEHISQFFPSPTSHPTIRKLLAGARRLVGKPPKRAAPMTEEILFGVVGVLRNNMTDIVLWRTVWRMAMEFYGLLRWSEAVALRWSDLKLSHSCLVVTIRSSKTDQHGSGSTVEIHSQGNGQTLECPVYLTAQYARKIGFIGGPFVDGFLQSRTGAGRTFQPHTQICYDTGVRDMRKYIRQAGFSAEGITEHSGRRGGASAAAASGVSWLALKRHGRWQSDEAAQKYVTDASVSGSTVAASLAAKAGSARRLFLLSPSAPSSTSAGGLASSPPGTGFGPSTSSSRPTPSTSGAGATAAAAAAPSRPDPRIQELIDEGYVPNYSLPGRVYFQGPNRITQEGGTR